MTTLWRAFEDAPVLMEVAEVWRQRLGTEFEPLSRFFTPTNRIASSMSFGKLNERWRIIEEPGRIVAFNDETYDHKFIERSDALLHRIDVRTLGREFCESLGWQYRFEALGSTDHICRVGVMPASLGALPVYFCIRKYPHDVVRAIHEVARHATAQFLFALPTSKPMDSEALMWVDRAGGKFIAAEDLVRFDDSTWSRSMLAFSDAKSKLQRILGIEVTEEPRFQFRLVGAKHRFVAFDSEPVVIQESPGSFYIAALLAAPHRIIQAIHLESMWTAINAAASTGSRGTKIDAEAKQNYESKIRSLTEEIEDIAALGGGDRLEELLSERDAIVETLRSATQRGNELREDTDANRARNSVGAAIRRSMKVIAKEHPPLAEHLTLSLSLGLELAYSPARNLDWYF